jgi:putative chitinase
MSLLAAFLALFRAKPDHIADAGNMVAPAHVTYDPPPGVAVRAVGDPDWPAILRAAGFIDSVTWAAHIAGPARRRGITAGRRAAAFAATIAHESGGGARLVEGMGYSAARLMAVWPSRFPTLAAARPLAWDPADDDREDIALANHVYGGRMGNERNGTADNDGWDYRGRGLIQITGRDGYSIAADSLGIPLVQQPDLAAQPNVAAEVAAWTWAAWKGCNPLADAGQVEAWRRAINGGLVGLDDVRVRYQRALAVQG